MAQVRELTDSREADKVDSRAPCLVPLDQAADRLLVGSKAANLAGLLRAGFPVPDGFVLTIEAFADFLAANGLDEAASPEAITAASFPPDLEAELCTAARSLGGGSLAVRSSAVEEDLPDASFAGQYETILDVDSIDLERAVKACWASAFNERVAAYRRNRGRPEPPRLAVLIQRLVPAATAGVAFTANPATAERGEVVISAIRGLGERLVSGEAVADEWVVRGGQAVCRISRDGAISAEQALAVAEVAQRIEAHFSCPQDVEWAIAEGQLVVLQARPMTALAEPVTWEAPLPGSWYRSFRLGEWLPEPLTPLFESWLVPSIEDRYATLVGRDFGVQPSPPLHVTVNGWYFHSQSGSGTPLGMLKGLIVRPHYLRVMYAFTQCQTRPELAERVVIGPATRRWREDLLPRYRNLVASWESRVDIASAKELMRLIDEVAGAAGEYFESMGVVAGFAWKSESALATFYRQHLLESVQRSPQELVRGLDPSSSAPVPHAVQSLDWFHPTLGELPAQEPRGDDEARCRQMEADRRAAEAACREVLADQPKLKVRFETLLDIAQRYAVLREEQTRDFTLGWPLLRRAALRLGDELWRAGTITRAEDIFFLTRSEVEEGLAGRSVEVRELVLQRRTTWKRQRRLSPPLRVGKRDRFLEKWVGRAAKAVRVPRSARSDGLAGMPASPGRATGPVRIVRGPDDFESFDFGEVLVAQATAPAWTRVFDRAVAVVTDGGTIAAHASLVAREYGIPAVVGVGNATARLRDGQVVTVDGSAGLVEVMA